MVTWYVKTKEEKSVEEHQIWTKNILTIRHITGYGWGKFSVQTNDEHSPTFNKKCLPEGNSDLDSVDLCDCGHKSNLVDLSDKWFEDFIWPDNMAEFARDNLETKWNNRGLDSWKELGWILENTEVWFSGPLEISQANIART